MRKIGRVKRTPRIQKKIGIVKMKIENPKDLMREWR
jgi:hypothetical protein